MQYKKTSEYSKMIELQDEIEGECINNTDFYFDQIGEPLPIKPSNSDPIFNLIESPSLLATHCLWTPPPHLRCALQWIMHCQNQGCYQFRQEPTDEVLRKKKEEEELWNVLEFGGMAGKKKGGKKDKKKE